MNDYYMTVEIKVSSDSEQDAETRLMRMMDHGLDSNWIDGWVMDRQIEVR